MEDNHLTNIEFSSLGLPAPMLRGITEAGFEHCTPIQAKSLPLLLAGQDISGQAQTGTGKTAAFLIAMFHRMLTSSSHTEQQPRQPRGLIIAPTRELAVQIHNDAIVLGKFTGFNIDLIYGGTGYDVQREIFKRDVDILIGTPGRMIDFYRQRLFNLKSIEALVLDEADRMFDLGFIKDIRYLLRRMPKPENRLTMLFSATLSYRVTELSYEHMNLPQLVRIETDRVTADKVKQAVYYASNEEKIPLLIGLLKNIDPQRTIVFSNTKYMANRICAYLQTNGFNAGILSGDVPQKKRLSLLKRFQNGELAILVATDVAARGLHIPDVSHIINFDLPHDAEDYVHRIGRTARAGASGDAISFACEEYSFSLPDIESFLGHKIPLMPITPDLLAEPKVPASIPRTRAAGHHSKGAGRDRKHQSRSRPRRGH